MKLTRRGENVKQALLVIGILVCIIAVGWLEAQPGWNLG